VEGSSFDVRVGKGGEMGRVSDEFLANSQGISHISDQTVLNNKSNDLHDYYYMLNIFQWTNRHWNVTFGIK
jgi:hypothetical protein